jgi:hypothetical protein
MAAIGFPPNSGRATVAPQTFLRHPVFMGRPDKPGDDDQGGMIKSSI